MTLTNDKYEPRYLEAQDIVLAKLREWEEMPVLTAARLGWQPGDNELKEVTLLDIEAWMREPVGELRPDTTQYPSVALGSATWRLIMSAMP